MTPPVNELFGMTEIPDRTPKANQNTGNASEKLTELKRISHSLKVTVNAIAGRTTEKKPSQNQLLTTVDAYAKKYWGD